MISQREASDLLFNVNKIKIAGTALKTIADYFLGQILVSVICGLLAFLWVGFAIFGIVITLYIAFEVFYCFKDAGQALSDSIEIKEEAHMKDLLAKI